MASSATPSSPNDARLATSGHFQQQGTLDWVNLVNSTYSTTVGILSRYSAGGVDPYTAVVGQALCNRFALSAVGRKHIDEALSSLQSFQSLGNALWFGFGVKNLVHALAATEQGSICLALCAALAECYHESVGAEVLVEATHRCDAPADLKPSVQQWKALVVACAGVLASTPFPNRVEHYSQLYLSYLPSLGIQLGQSKRTTSAESMADVLLAVGKVSKKELASITIVGGVDAGWVVAIAEWIFNLTITIMDSTEKVFFTNCESTAEAQLLWIFDDGRYRKVTSKSNELSLRITESTYILNSAADLLPQGVASTMTLGRVKWDNVLFRIFGSDFDALMSMPKAFGGAIGTAARIYKAITIPEEKVPIQFRRKWSFYCGSSYGQGFIDNTIRWFPELEPLRQDMNQGLRETFDDSKAKYEAYLSTISLRCDCEICQGCVSHYVRQKNCLMVMVDTIIEIARCLSNVTVPESLYACRAGFEIIYSDHEQLRSRKSENEVRRKDLGQVHFTMDNLEMRKRLHQIHQLFTGQATEWNNRSLSAISRNSICVYFNILHEISDNDEVVDRINIVPGRIEFNGKAYDSLSDYIDRDNLRPTYEAILVQEYENVSIVVKERVEGLLIGYEFYGDSQDSSKSRKLGPASLVNTIVATRGLVVCNKRACAPLNPDVSAVLDMMRKVGSLKRHCYKLIVANIVVDLFHSSAALSRCGVVGMGANFDSEGVATILAEEERECINCCIKHFVQLGSSNLLLVVGSGVRRAGSSQKTLDLRRRISADVSNDD